MTKMLGHDFEIIYKNWKQNVFAYALSRKYEDVESLLYDISIIQPDWIAEEMDEWKNDEKNMDIYLKDVIVSQCL